MAELNFNGIGMDGLSLGKLRLHQDGLDFRDKSGAKIRTIGRDSVSAAKWGVYGNRSQVKLDLRDGGFARMDGFDKTDYEKLNSYFLTGYGLELHREDVACNGAHFGEVSLMNRNLVLNSVDNRPVMELKLDDVVQCVIPPNSRDEIEIQFQESDAGDREADSLVQITFHLPFAEDLEEGTEDSLSTAERLQQEIMATGVIQSTTGNVIVEFSKEQVLFFELA